jgi:hypothetical protein
VYTVVQAVWKVIGRTIVVEDNLHQNMRSYLKQEGLEAQANISA